MMMMMMMMMMTMMITKLHTWLCLHKAMLAVLWKCRTVIALLPQQRTPLLASLTYLQRQTTPAPSHCSYLDIDL
jgi:hypothetical protein